MCIVYVLTVNPKYFHVSHGSSYINIPDERSTGQVNSVCHVLVSLYYNSVAIFVVII